MFPIIDRYILRESLRSFLAIFAVLILILVSHGFTKVLQKAAEGTIPHDLLLQIVALESFLLISPVVPPAFFFSILYSLGRMYRDSEMTALAAGGVGLGRIYRSYLLLAIPLSLLVGWFTLSLTPSVERQLTKLRDTHGATATLGAAVAGKFNEFSSGDLVFYIEGISENKSGLKGIFVQNRKHGKLGLITAAEGRQWTDEESGDHFVILNHGFRYEGQPGGNEYSVGEFDSYGIRIAKDERQRDRWPRNTMATEELRHSEDIKDYAELQHRYMFPFTIIVFMLISIPLARSLPREGIYGRLMLAILFYFLFVNLQALSDTWLKKGVTPHWLGLWWIHPVMLALAAGLLFLRSPRADRIYRHLYRWRRGS